MYVPMYVTTKIQKILDVFYRNLLIWLYKKISAKIVFSKQVT